MIRPILILLLLAVPASAQSFLTSTNTASAQARSHAQALSNGVDPNGVTQFWWPIIGGTAHLLGAVPPNATQAAIAIGSSGFYSTQGLTAPEVAALQTPAMMSSTGWTIPPAAIPP